MLIDILHPMHSVLQVLACTSLARHASTQDRGVARTPVRHILHRTDAPPPRARGCSARLRGTHARHSLTCPRKLAPPLSLAAAASASPRDSKNGRSAGCIDRGRMPMYRSAVAKRRPTCQ